MSNYNCSGDVTPTPKPTVLPSFLTYKTGSNVKLVHKAEYCKSIIADGEELITGKESGELVVPELKDGNVYITFKEDLTSLANAFYGCSALTTIPENLFANCPKVTDFSYTFYNCTAVTGESPYTMIGDKKVHLYERKNYPEHFTETTNRRGCFNGCTGLSDYAQIPSSWK